MTKVREDFGECERDIILLEIKECKSGGAEIKTSVFSEFRHKCLAANYMLTYARQ